MAVNQELTGYFPADGRIEWIGLRPERRQPMQIVQTAHLIADHGIEGDHRAQTEKGKRQVTLVQHESLETMQTFLGLDSIVPEMLRRNIVVSGINLMALIDKQFCIGGAILMGVSPCHPCSRMEETLGHGGYNAMRGYGGISAAVLKSGEIAVGNVLSVV